VKFVFNCTSATGFTMSFITRFFFGNDHIRLIICDY
jgi:hypothetical protein